MNEGWGRKVIIVALGCSIVAGGLTGVAVANHVGAKPKTVTAWYMDTVSESILYNMGCAQGNRVDSGTDPDLGVVILTFGGPRQFDGLFPANYGASLFSGVDKNVNQIREGMEDYVRGFYNCLGSGSGVLYYVGIGVTNQYPSGFSINEAGLHGHAWANMVAQVRQYIANQGYGGDVSAFGANDIEPDYGGPDRTRNWADTYDSIPNAAFYFDFGGAAGCPQIGETHGCNNGWSLADRYHVAWGVPSALSTPQIYRTDGISAGQWVRLSQWGVNNQGDAIDFAGPVTQEMACNQVGGCTNDDNTPTMAWNQMDNKMHLVPSTVVPLERSIDIGWRNP